MLKKNFFKKVPLAVLAMCLCICSVRSVCLASNPKTANQDQTDRPEVNKKPSLNIKPTKGNSKYVDWDDSDSDYDGNVNDGYNWEEEEKEEWNEPMKKGDEKVGNNVFTAGEENNNLNDNDDPSANAEESGTQKGNTATNNDNQNNHETPQNINQRGSQRTVTPWHLIVFDDDNNK